MNSAQNALPLRHLHGLFPHFRSLLKCHCTLRPFLDNLSKRGIPNSSLQHFLSLFPAHFFLCCTCYQMTYSIFSFLTICLHSLENRLLGDRDCFLFYSRINPWCLGQTHSRRPEGARRMSVPPAVCPVSRVVGRGGGGPSTPCPTARPHQPRP